MPAALWDGGAVDIAALTAFLAGALPYLLRGAESAADDAVRTLGAGAWEHAQKLWGRLRGRMQDDPVADGVAHRAAEQPQDQRTQTQLQLELERLLEEDPDLARDVARLWDEARAAGVTKTGAAIASGPRSIAVSGTATGTFNTGDNSTV